MKSSCARRLPSEKIVMRPGWHHLLFLHWSVPAAEVQQRLPAGLQVDLFEGRAYLGLVPFTMTAVRPHPLPAYLPLRRCYEDFHEINVRTYVHRTDESGRRIEPGVWFFSLDAASALAVGAARAWYHLPYFYARMTLAEQQNSDQSTCKYFYQSRRLWPAPLPAQCEIEYTPHGTPAPAAPHTPAHFLIERYLLYSFARGQLWKGRVAHAPYQIQDATLSHLQENLIAAAGFVRPDTAPLIHYAHGVQTEIFSLQRCL